MNPISFKHLAMPILLTLGITLGPGSAFCTRLTAKLPLRRATSLLLSVLSVGLLFLSCGHPTPSRDPRPVVAARGDTLHVAPAPEGALLRQDYRVRVRIPEGEWRDVPVYGFLVAAGSLPLRHADTTCVAPFSFAGEVEVEVTPLHCSPDSFRIRPLAAGIEATRQGGTLTFALDKPCYLSIEVNGDTFHNLHLLADSLGRVPEEADIVFPPGLHEIAGDSLLIPSGTTVYVAPGALVKGWLLVADATDVQILGQGILLPPDSHGGVEVHRSRRVLVDGPLTTRLPIGESDSVEVRNVKVFSSFPWGDGFNLYACSHIWQHHLLARTSDDCSTVYCTRKGFRGSSHHIRVEDAVFWPDVAHPVMIGLHGDTAKREEVYEVIYDNIDILGQCEHQLDYQGCIAINDGDNILVHDLTFSRLRIDDLQCGMLFNLRVCFNQKYCTAPGRGIRGIRFNDISYNGHDPNPSLIIGYDDSRKVEDIRFSNLTINGTHITDDMAGKPGWYQTADMARIFVGEHVSGITFGMTNNE